MTEFETRVAEALAGIPHSNLCWCSKGREAYKMGPCICYAEREAALAPRVAAAIDAASLVPLARMSNTSGVARTELDEDARAAGLSALRGETP